MRVKAIEPAGVADVYNMEVEDTHDFAVANGVIVHNCYDECRYVLMEAPISPRATVIPESPMGDPLNQFNRRNTPWR